MLTGHDAIFSLSKSQQTKQRNKRVIYVLSITLKIDKVQKIQISF